MQKSFNRESLPQIKESLEHEVKINKEVLESIIQTVRRLVFYDHKKQHISEKYRSIDDSKLNDTTWDFTLESDGNSSDFGTINLKVYNSYLRDYSEDGLADTDNQTVEISYKGQQVFKAVAPKEIFAHFGGLESDPDPNAELKDFHVEIFKEGAWLLPLIKIGMEIKK